MSGDDVAFWLFITLITSIITVPAIYIYVHRCPFKEPSHSVIYEKYREGHLFSTEGAQFIGSLFQQDEYEAVWKLLYKKNRDFLLVEVWRLSPFDIRLVADQGWIKNFLWQIVLRDNVDFNELLKKCGLTITKI